jgi:hypothetical protein
MEFRTNEHDSESVDRLIGDELHLTTLLAALEAGQDVVEWDDVLVLGGVLRDSGLDDQAVRLEAGLTIDTELAITVIRSTLSAPVDGTEP